jgi:hypothetical protein
MLRSKNIDTINGLEEKIHSITQYQKQYIRKILGNLGQVNGRNANVICEYISAEQNEINIKESTKEGNISTVLRSPKTLTHATRALEPIMVDK